MLFEEFERALRAKHPNAEATPRKGGGIDVVFEPGGKVYSYRGTYISIAEDMKLVELWYVYRNGEVAGKAHFEDTARELCDQLAEDDRRTAAMWNVSPSIFTFRRVS